MRNTWGARVAELLDEANKKPAWLAKNVGVARSTVTNWINSRDLVRPDPDTVAKVAKAFGKSLEYLMPYAGYPMIHSNSAAEREARAAALQPRLTKRGERAVELFEGLSPSEQDIVLSMLEGLSQKREG